MVDDDPESRESLTYAVEDADLQPVMADGPLGNLEEMLASNLGADAVLSDFELRAHSYATFTGAQLVAGLQKRGIPGVLCTKYERAQLERIRPFRRWIPALLKPEELNPETLVAGLRQSVEEMSGTFRPERRPWRTLIRFVEPDPEDANSFFVEVPSWNSDERIRVDLALLPPDIRQAVVPDYRCHADANLATDSFEELYLSEWSAP